MLRIVAWSTTRLTTINACCTLFSRGWYGEEGKESEEKVDEEVLPRDWSGGGKVYVEKQGTKALLEDLKEKEKVRRRPTKKEEVTWPSKSGSTAFPISA